MKKDRKDKVTWGESPELRFPRRLEKVRRLGVEIAMTIGEFGPPFEGRPKCAMLADFHIAIFTPFNRPTGRPGIDWDDKKVQRELYGLTISRGGRTVLEMTWTADRTYVERFRYPSLDSWDRSLRDRSEGDLRQVAQAGWRRLALCLKPNSCCRGVFSEKARRGEIRSAAAAQHWGTNSRTRPH